MGNTKDTGFLRNLISYDASGNIVLPANLTVTGSLLANGGVLYATQSYVTTQISNLVNSAPSTLDTLNELASALGNDASFATTVTTSIATKVPQTRTITINGTALDLSADRSWTIAGGVTGFNTRTGAITLLSADVTTALGYTPMPTITFYTPLYVASGGEVNIRQSNSIQSGYLSFTDWNIFNGKQDALSGTGFVKISGSTISYDNSTYALDSAVVKLTGTQTISGVKTFTGAGNTFTQNTNFQDRIYLKSPTTTTYSSLGGDDNKILVGVIGATHEFTFTPNTNYSYTFPATSGTLALTSNLSSYLPLGGGTMSGTLNFANGDGGLQNAGSGGISFYNNEINAGSQGVTGDLYLAWRRTNSVNIGQRLIMGTVSGVQQWIRMGVFSNSQTNTGEAWIGRASDRSAGIMTVQLGGSSNGSFFEVVDFAWTTVILKVGMNDFSYKGNTILHAGNISSQSVVTIQDSAPSGSVGRLWWESDTGKLKVYYGSAWVDASPIPDMSLYYSRAGGPIYGDVTVQQTLNVVGNTLVQGNIKAFGDITANTSSDARLKDNIAVIEFPLEKVSKINGVSFNWNDKQSVYEVGKKDYGVVAQEIEQVLPELVTTRDNGYKAVRYEKIVALLIEAIKEQQTQINKLTDKFNNL